MDSSDAPPQLVIISGAGLSAESGLQTFRDNDGLWEGHNVHDVCNIATWRKNFEMVHSFYSQRREAAQKAAPNKAHEAMARWQSRWPTKLLTQNVDDLLERAGCTDVVHLHGRLTDMWCHACNHEWVHGFEPWVGGINSCPKCSARRDVKPGIVFFGEQAPEYSKLYDALHELRPVDILLVVGTSGQVLPVADFAGINPGLNILNNLTQSKNIPDNTFDHIFYCPVTEAVNQIQNILEDTFG